MAIPTNKGILAPIRSEINPRERRDNGYGNGHGYQDEARTQGRITHKVLQKKGKKKHRPEDSHSSHKVNDIGHQEIMDCEKTEVDDWILSQEP